MEITYLNKVFAYLQKMEANQPKEVDKLASKETKEQFIQAIKHAIDLRLGWKQGYCIEFNQDFTKFKKKKI